MSSVAAGSKVLLLVECDPHFAFEEKAGLERRGYSVRQADDEESAIKAAHDTIHPVDLVLMDLDPEKGMDGVEAARRILERRNLPIVFLSTCADAALLERSQSIAAYGYVIKDNGIAVLDAAIKTAFRLFDSGLGVARRDAELKASEGTFRGIADAAIEGIWVLDAEGKTTYVNDSAAKILGYLPDEILGAHFGDFVDEDARGEARQLFDRERHDIRKGQEFRFRRKDGSSAWTSLNSAPVLDAEGRRSGLLCLLTDIGESRNAELALKESLELFSLYILNSPIYAFIKEVSPSESRVLYASENYVDMIGVPGSRMGGKTMEELFPPDFAARISADDWAVVSDGKILKLYEDLGDRNYSTVKYPIELGQRRLLAGYTIDITELKRAEAEARRQVREKELILKEVQHRTKNNIALIESLLQLQASRSPSEEARNGLMAAMSRIESMRELYEQLLLGTSFETVSTRKYLEELAHSIAAIFPDSERIDLLTDIEDFEMCAERVRLVGSIVNELITNSLKYAFADGARGYIRLGLSREGEEAILVVEDSGKGLPEGFDPAKSGGFGMMLVDFLSQQLKASISFGSGRGARSTLRFRIGT